MDPNFMRVLHLVRTLVAPGEEVSGKMRDDRTGRSPHIPRAVILIRLLVGLVFFEEGVQKFLFPALGPLDPVAPKAERLARTAELLTTPANGRFARTVRLGRPCDASRARAQCSNGELRITVPKIAERRGRTLQIEVMANG